MEPKEILFLILFFVFWIFSQLSKKEKKQEEKKGFTVRLLEFIAAFKEANENEMNMPEPVEPQPAPVKLKMTEAVVSTSAHQVARPGPAAIIVRPVAQKTVAPTIEAFEKKMAAPPEFPIIAPERKRAAKKFTQRKIREAIVWSEILGAPVALRDD